MNLIILASLLLFSLVLIEGKAALKPDLRNKMLEEPDEWFECIDPCTEPCNDKACHIRCAYACCKEILHKDHDECDLSTVKWSEGCGTRHPYMKNLNIVGF